MLLCIDKHFLLIINNYCNIRIFIDKIYSLIIICKFYFFTIFTNTLNLFSEINFTSVIFEQTQCFLNKFAKIAKIT